MGLTMIWVLIAVAAIWGGITVVLASGFAYFYWRVRDAEKHRDEAESVALKAMDKVESIESDAMKLKQFFEQALNRPSQAIITEDQVKAIADALATELLPYTSGIKVN